ncbi:sugar transporter [Helicobacter sp. T3_23-1056]
MTPMQKKRAYISFVSWLPVLSLACAAFVFNTSEFIPIGLLSAIASDFGMSEAGAGWIITIYAWVVALASLPLMLSFSHTELRRLMLCVMIVFVLSHALSAISMSFAMLMISRIGVALSHALFWSIASPMAIKAAPRGKHGMALGFIVAGSSLALTAGLPIGRVIGLYVAWRSTFACIGVVAFLILVLFWRVFPAMPSSQNISFKTLPTLFANTPFRKICILTLVFITGEFCAYSYIEPFLAKEIKDSAVTYALIVFGGSGILASIAFSKYYDKHHLAFVNLCLFGVVGSLLSLYFIAHSLWLVILLCGFWGFAIACFNIVFQSQTIASVPEASAVAMSIFSGIYNVGIGSGAFIGGVVCERVGVEFVGFVGGGVAFVACMYYVRKMPFARAFRYFRLKKMR